MNRKIPAVMLICLIFFLLMMATSCSNLLGYGVLLWSLPDQELYSGDIVPVYIKSNISHVYVIGTGDSKEDKMEIPLWQIELFKSKKVSIPSGTIIIPNVRTIKFKVFKMSL